MDHWRRGKGQQKNRANSSKISEKGEFER